MSGAKIERINPETYVILKVINQIMGNALRNQYQRAIPEINPTPTEDLKMRITPELIESSYQYTNRATTDRELRLRALKITAIENLGATLNQFDCFDLSDNSIRKLGNLPLLPRLKCLLLNNNRIFKISANLEQVIPNLERLILTNNHIQELGDIDTLSQLKNLRSLSLLNNPVTAKPNYRLYVINKLPSLRLLDFSKVRQKERDEAAALFPTVINSLSSK